jgi:hypothetical protein
MADPTASDGLPELPQSWKAFDLIAAGIPLACDRGEFYWRDHPATRETGGRLPKT